MTGQAGQDLIAACGQIVVINLPERADRRAEFEVQLNRIGLSFKDPSVRIFDAIRPTAREGFPSIGARGCFLSHLAVLRKALEDGAEKVLLCEDDLNFTQTFPSRARDLRAALDREDWDIFYGFTAGGLRGENLDAEGQLVALSGDHAFIGTHIVAFKRRAILRLVPYLEAMLTRPEGDPMGGPMHVDGAYVWFRKAYSDIRVLAAREDIGYQRSSSTDVSTQSMSDRLPILRQCVNMARKWRTAMFSR